MSLNKTVNSPDKLAQKPITAERMHDVKLLLQNLANNEEATIKLIVDCLYDVGSVNLINQKLRFRPLNRSLKLIARMSKPVFRTVAWYWFKNNCPQLITDWLQSKVTFEEPIEEPIDKPKEINVEVLALQPYSPSQTESLSREVRYLRHQSRWLMGITIVSLLSLGVTVIKLTESRETPLQSRQQTQSIMPR